MQQTQQTAPPVQQTPSPAPAPTQQTQQPVQPNQYYQQYQVLDKTKVKYQLMTHFSNRLTELILMHIINIINTIKLTISLHSSQRLYNNNKCLLLHLGRLR